MSKKVKKNFTTGYYIIISTISIAIVSLAGFYNSKKTIEKSSFNSFKAIRESKKQQIESYFNQIRKQCQTFAKDLMIISAMKEFKNGYDTIIEQLNYSPQKIEECTNNLKKYYKNEYLNRLNANAEQSKTLQDYFPHMLLVTKILQYLYISNNPNPVGQKDNLNNANDGSNYSKVHAKYHPIIREYLKKFGYYDIFLVDIKTGALVYTCYKEVDFSTSLLTGPFNETNIATLFKDVQETQIINFNRFVDFKFYDPSYAKPASFVGTPIYDNNKKIGVLIFQIPIDKINAIMTNDRKWQETGFGKTGEAFLIGPDYAMRTDSRFLIENPDKYFQTLQAIGTPKNIIDKIRLLKSTILVQEINTPASREVIRGNTNTLIEDSYLNIPVLSAFTDIDLTDFKWGLLIEINYSEIVAPVYTLAQSFLLWGIIALLFVIIFILIFSRYRGRKK